MCIDTYNKHVCTETYVLKITWYNTVSTIAYKKNLNKDHRYGLEGIF